MLLSLKTQKDFALVNSVGKIRSSRNFKLIFAATVPYTEQSRSESTSTACTVFLGIKASKRLGSAVVRNKIKRRIRHLVRRLVSRFSGYSLVFIPYKGMHSVNFATLETELYRILKERSCSI